MTNWNIGSAKRLIKAAGFFPRKEPRQAALGIWTASHVSHPDARKLRIISYAELLAPDGEDRLQHMLAELTTQYRRQLPRVQRGRGPGNSPRSSH